MRGLSLSCVSLLALVAVSGCHKQPSPEQARQRLTGKYHLAGKECGSEVKSSTLELRSDGSYDQHVEFATGESLNEVGQQWSYDGGVHFSNFRITATGELNKYAPETETSLLVELSHPVVILLDPSGGCFYSQPK